MKGTVLLSGIVGSIAYGLAHQGSDTDILGVYAAPTTVFHGLHPPIGKEATYKEPDSDTVYHEAGKMANLLLKMNPTVTELLWLEEYLTRTSLGEDLVSIRRSFLSRKLTKDAYLGYATAQYHRMENRSDGSFSADTRKRTAKHARHLTRLILQGTALHKTGDLAVQLTPAQAQECVTLGELVAADPERGLHEAKKVIAAAETVFDAPGVLPEQPDKRTVEEWLQRVRGTYYVGAAFVLA